jgi:hypothetical protein
MFYRQRKYFQFLLKSSNQHGVHSPFVYQLVTKCLYKKIDKDSWKTFQTSNNKLLKNKKIKNSHKKAKILLKLIHYFKPKNNLEIANSLDLEVTALAMNFSYSCVTAIANTPLEISEVTLNRKFDCVYFHKNQITLVVHIVH